MEMKKLSIDEEVKASERDKYLDDSNSYQSYRKKNSNLQIPIGIC